MNHVWMSRSTGHRTQQQLHGENLYHALYYVQPVLLDLIGSWLYDLVVGIVLVFFFYSCPGYASQTVDVP